MLKPNPKRPGSASHGRYDKYIGAANVGEYLQMGGTPADLRYDIEQNFVQLLDDPPQELHLMLALDELIDHVSGLSVEPAPVDVAAVTPLGPAESVASASAGLPPTIALSSSSDSASAPADGGAGLPTDPMDHEQTNVDSSTAAFVKEYTERVLNVVTRSASAGSLSDDYVQSLRCLRNQRSLRCSDDLVTYLFHGHHSSVFDNCLQLSHQAAFYGRDWSLLARHESRG